MQLEDRDALRALVDAGRQASLGTLADDGSPFVSMVLYALERQPERVPTFLIHVSRLATHTAQLQADRRVSLLIMQPDLGESDPQALHRVTVQATATVVPVDSQGYIAARGAYLSRLPQQEHLFNMPDFLLVRLEPLAVRYVGGFAKAFSLDVPQLADVLGER